MNQFKKRLKIKEKFNSLIKEDLDKILNLNIEKVFKKEEGTLFLYHNFNEGELSFSFVYKIYFENDISNDFSFYLDKEKTKNKNFIQIFDRFYKNNLSSLSYNCIEVEEFIIVKECFNSLKYCLNDQLIEEEKEESYYDLIDYMYNYIAKKIGVNDEKLSS